MRGLRWLCNKIYHPDAFANRVIHMLERLGPSQGPSIAGGIAVPEGRNQLARDTAQVIQKLAQLGPTERAMLTRIIRYTLLHRPDSLGTVASCLRMYAQIRSMYETHHVWESGCGPLGDITTAARPFTKAMGNS